MELKEGERSFKQNAVSNIDTNGIKVWVYLW